MTMTVTAQQGGSTGNGMILRVMVLTGAALLQNGGTANAQKSNTNTFTLSITTTQGGSRVYGAGECSPQNTATAAAATTLIDNVADGTNADQYVTFKATALTGTPGATTLGYTQASSSSGPLALLEVKTAGGLTEDPSAPAVASTTSTTSVTTAAFSPPPGSLLVALVSSDGGTGTVTMTVSGGNLIWTQKVSNNTSDYAGVWTAFVPVPADIHQPVRARRQPVSLTGRAYRTPAAVAVAAPPVVTLAPVYPLTQPARAKLPPGPPASGCASNQQTGNSSGGRYGRIFANPGAPVQNPSQGPVFRQATSPARARLPKLQPRAGRAYGNPGTPARNPSSGPAFPAAPGPAKARALPFSRGRFSANAGAPVRNPSSGPPVKPLAAPAQARRPLPPRGRVSGSTGAPVQNPAAPAVSRQPGYPARARIPAPFSKGRASGNQGAPVRNPTQGPLFRLPRQPARAPVPPAFSKGRAYGNPGTVLAAVVPVQQQPLAGPAGVLVSLVRGGAAATSSVPAPVRNPTSGPVFRLAAQPSRSRQPLPPRGRTTGSRGAPVQNPAPPAVVTVRPLGTIRARLPVPVLPGRAATMAALPAPANPSAGPVFLLPSQPARARLALPPRGRAYGNAGAPVNNPAPPVTQVSAYRLTSPVRARLPRPLTGRAITTHAVSLPAPVYAQQVLTQPAGTLVFLLRAGHVQASVQTSPVHNPPPPSTTPVVPLSSPAGLRVIFSRIGSGAGSPGAPVQNPVHIGAVVYPLTQPVRARQPLPAPGRAATMASLPVPVTPSSGAAFPALTSPARTRILPPPRGRSYGSRGAPVNNPAQSSGPPFPPLRQPVRARQPLPARGRDYLPLPYKAPVNPVPSSGPPFPPLTSPAGLRVIFSRIGTGAGSFVTPAAPPAPVPAKFYPPVQAIRARPGTFSKGRTSGNAGAPIHNPVTGQGPPFYPQGTIRFRITLPPRGRAYGSKGAPVTHAGPPVTPLQGPSRARLPKLQPRAGRAYGNPGTPPVHSGPPARPLTAPVRAPVPATFSKGRATGNPGAPVNNPVIRIPVLNKALRAQPPVFLKGRVAGNAGAPVHNPTSGPVFRQATQPARFRITLPPRGRVYGNLGAPVVNPIEGAVPPGTLYLTPGTIIQGRPYATTTISTPDGTLTITSAMTGVTVISPAAEGFAPSPIVPPGESDFPPPDPVVVPAYVQR